MRSPAGLSRTSGCARVVRERRRALRGGEESPDYVPLPPHRTLCPDLRAGKEGGRGKAMLAVEDTALSFLKRKKVLRVRTGISLIDSAGSGSSDGLLGGEVVLLCGPHGAGKSRVACAMAGSAVLPSRLGDVSLQVGEREDCPEELVHTVVYFACSPKGIDVTGLSRVIEVELCRAAVGSGVGREEALSRGKQIFGGAEGLGARVKELLGKITVHRPASIEELVRGVLRVGRGTDSLRLVVLDGVEALLASDPAHAALLPSLITALRRAPTASILVTMAP
eukprot:Sspe_Gene.85524::Locus_56281_Transcript_1_1_Confidence_1.000_Length_1000::g.85524::m.85524